MQIYKIAQGKRIHNQSSMYFLTFTIENWIDLFTRQSLRDIITESLNYCTLNKGLIIYAYVIMSNHIHLVCSAQNNNLSDIVRDFKKHTNREIIFTIKTSTESRKEWLLWMFTRAGKRAGRNGYKIWKNGNAAMELLTNKFIDQKINYIHKNPVDAGIVGEDFHYLYSSALDYSGIKGLVAVTCIH